MTKDSVYTQNLAAGIRVLRGGLLQTNGILLKFSQEFQIIYYCILNLCDEKKNTKVTILALICSISFCVQPSTLFRREDKNDNP